MEPASGGSVSAPRLKLPPAPLTFPRPDCAFPVLAGGVAGGRAPAWGSP